MRPAARKLIAITALLAAVPAALFAYRLVSPEITVSNRSGAVIDEVVVQLPSSRVSVGPLADDDEHTVYHSAEQADGVYRYRVRWADGRELDGACGYVTGSDYGRRLELVLMRGATVDCRISDKLG